MEHESASPSPIVGARCPSCGGEVAPNLLSCPSCHRLVHAERLKELAGSAEAAERAGEPSSALASWREAITLLPPASRQHAVIADRIARLSRQVEAGPVRRQQPLGTEPRPGPAGHPPTASRWSGGAITGVVGTLALAVWKFKFLAVLLLTKAKFLLLGLTKASTFFSMLAAFGVYWTVFGGWFALGFVLSIYIHEMGHVAALMRYGVQASAPLFIPGLGAVIRLEQAFIDPEARRPRRPGRADLGLGAAAGLRRGLCLSPTSRSGRALARVGAWINLFNLMPIWQLDGGRAFHSLTRPQRWLAVTAVATAWAVHRRTARLLLLMMMAVGAFRAAVDKPADEPDRGILVQYVALVAVLSALIQLPVPICRATDGDSTDPSQTGSSAA